MKIRSVSCILILAAAATLVGCASPLTKKSDGDSPFAMSWPWSKEKKAEPYPNPVKMAVTWTPDVLVQPGRTPTRGFGGRVYFYNEKSQAVPVDGDLVVHAFNEDLAAAGSPDSVKRYRFESEQFTQHFSETDLGASYSVWIPWDAAGGYQTKLSMVPTFRTAEGKIVQGEAATMLLPGKKPVEIASDKSKPAVRQVGHYVGGNPNGESLNTQSRMQTTTIPLPTSFQQRLARMPEQSLEKRRAPISSLPTPTAAIEQAATTTLLATP